MLTPERLAALTATADGTLTIRRANAPGSPLTVHPREYTVAFGYLRKAQLVEIETVGGRKPKAYATVTERGNRVLAQR